MLTLLSTGEILRCDDYYLRELADGLDELIFQISIWDPAYPRIVEEARIRDRDAQVYLVKQIDGGPDVAKVICQIDLDAWRSEMHLGYSNGGATALQTVSGICPTGWTVSDQSGSTIHRTVQGSLTSLEICEAVRDAFAVWIRWDTAAKTCTILPAALPEPSGAFATRDLNLKQINYKGKSLGLVTRLYAYGQDDLSFASINQGKPYVENFTYTDKILPAFWKDEKYTDAASLLHDASEKLAGMAVPVRSYDCAVMDLAATDPEKYGALSFPLFSVATLIDDVKNFAVNYQVVERRVYPYYPARNEVVFDSSPQRITAMVEETAEILSTKVSQAEMQTEVDRATGVLQTGRSGYVVIGRNSNGYANEIYILDTNSLSTAQKVLRINNAGIGFSSSGVSGPYYQAWTLDGHLSLGGVNNAYGHLSILNPSGSEIGSWSKDGITIDQGVIDLLRGAGKVGLYVNGAIVRIGDFEVNDAYGRQVLESDDEKTGMSGEPDQQGGLYLWAGYNDENDYAFVVNNSRQTVVQGQLWVRGEDSDGSYHNYNVVDQIAKLWDAIRDIDSGGSGPGEG
jgi:hypothetical protein